MTVSVAAISGHTYWAIALGIAFGAAVIVAILLTLLLTSVGSIEKSVEGLEDFYMRFIKMHGDGGLMAAALACMEKVETPQLLSRPTDEKARKQGSVSEAIKHVIDAAFPAGGEK